MCHVCVTAKRAHQLSSEARAPNHPQALTPGFFLGGSRRGLGSGGPKKSPKMAKKYKKIHFLAFGRTQSGWRVPPPRQQGGHRPLKKAV